MKCPICTTMLPLRVREQMTRALQVDPGVPTGESPARTRALDGVVFHARLHYPHLFRQKF